MPSLSQSTHFTALWKTDIIVELVLLSIVIVRVVTKSAYHAMGHARPDAEGTRLPAATEAYLRCAGTSKS